MGILEFLIATGILSTVMGFLVWILKRHIDKRDAEQDKRTKNIQALMMLILKDTRSTNVLAMATAKAVQRIPDAHCNGDMTEALGKADEIQKEEKDFFTKQGLEHLFDND